MSQVSNYPLPLPGEDLDNLTPYLQSDDVNLFTEQSFSQQTIISLPDSEFLLPPPIPTSLTRVGLGLKKIWILYEMDKKTEFIEWWLQTLSRREAPKDKKKFRFETDGNKAEVWKHFDQVAHHTSGEPKVMCRRCSKTLDHPAWTGNGTNSMRRHWDSDKCLKSLTRAGQKSKQPNIQRLMEQAV